MFEVVYMKADYEPWWMFEGWEEEIIERHSFHQLEEAIVFLHRYREKFAEQYEFQQSKENCFFAYWSTKEKLFCEGCDEDLQVYHGLVFLVRQQPTNFESFEIN